MMATPTSEATTTFVSTSESLDGEERVRNQPVAHLSREAALDRFVRWQERRARLLRERWSRRFFITDYETWTQIEKCTRS